MRPSVPHGEDIRFVFFDSNAHARDKLFLKYIRKKYKAKLVLYVMNPTSSIALDPGLCSNFYDSVFTVFAKDADCYGWHAYQHLYRKYREQRPAVERQYDADIFFAGRAKNSCKKYFMRMSFW